MKKIIKTQKAALKIDTLSGHPFAEQIYHVSDIDILANSMKTEGLLHDIVVDKESRIISGRRRWLAAKQLGWQEIRASIIDNLTEAEVQQLIISSNQQRKKTFMEFLSEARYVLGTLGTSQGKERELLGNPDSEDDFGTIGGDRFALAAKYIGSDMSGATLRRLITVDNFEKEHPEVDLGLIDKISRKLMSVNKAYDLTKLYAERVEEQGGVEPEKANPENLSNPANYNIYWGSCKNMKEIADDSVKMIGTSIPYYQLRGYEEPEAKADKEREPELGQEETPEEFIERLIPYLFEMKRVLKSTGSIFLNVGDTYNKDYNNIITQRVVMAACGVVKLHLINELIFAKDNMLPQTTNKRLQPSHEKVFHFVKDVSKYEYTPFKVLDPNKKIKPYKIDRPNKKGGMDIGDYSLSKGYKRFKDFISKQEYNDIINYCSVNKETLELKQIDPDVKHPAPFSTSLMLLPMLCVTMPGEITLDPFGGSGSFLVTSVLMGRVGIMYEKEERFAKLAAKRLQEIAKTINLNQAAYIEQIAKEPHVIDITGFANQDENDTSESKPERKEKAA